MAAYLRKKEMESLDDVKAAIVRQNVNDFISAGQGVSLLPPDGGSTFRCPCCIGLGTATSKNLPVFDCKLFQGDFEAHFWAHCALVPGADWSQDALRGLYTGGGEAGRSGAGGSRAAASET